ncbi:MAG: pilus assembly protein [Ignavibacteria bacterium RIFOXYC2_FULL_35_21]|nr:MAG: pilus assembly protein [Ignavibacteria bacterium RIFOXYA2_FULL_35_10]OGV24806.1 MAG: pilus assembly protein [Ignavibacteria bacterium RIFOXYC2_FULL_35_21]
MILCDTNILIELYKGNKNIISELKKIGTVHISISIVTSAELIFGAINKKELNQIKKDIDSLNLITIDEQICDIFIDLMLKYSLSHKITLPDALIAATALSRGFQLYTLNLKDFKFIENLKLYKPVTKS